MQVLNVRSTFSEAEIGQLCQRPTYQELAEMPVLSEVLRAISQLSNGKAAGKFGMLSEMLKVNSRSSTSISINLSALCGAL